MLKRLLSVFGGNKNSPTVAHAAPQSAAIPVKSSNKNELITVYDAYGREIKITRNDWRDKMLLPNLEKKWNDSDALYGLMITALNDGFEESLLPAAQHLVEIDSNPERSHTVHGIVLMKNGNLTKAEATIRAGMSKVGETGTLLTNLAKVIFEKGDETRAKEILWQAVVKEPNLDNGLMWWLALQRDLDGEAGYLKALHTIAALPGSWRAQLWLARNHLDVGEIEDARNLYKEILSSERFDPSALMMISGDLGTHGQIQMIPELVGPVYQPTQHDPVAGLNLLRAYQELRRPDEGEALLAKLYALDLAPYKQHLDQFAHAFQQMRKETQTGKPIDPSQLKMSTRALTQPIWQYGFRNADWLFQQKPELSEQVGFFAFSKIISGHESAEEQREDDLGRLTRAIPLYLAESTHYWTDFAATTYVLVVDGGGPVVSGVEPEGAELFDIVPPNMHWLVTGQIGSSVPDGSGEWKLSFRLWDCIKRELAKTESETTTLAELGTAVLRLEQRLLTSIGKNRGVPLDSFYLRPSTEAIKPYLVELGQAFMLTLLANEAMPKNSLWGERAMLDWPLSMALQWRTVEVPKLMYLSGLGKALDYKSDVLPEYKARTLQLLREIENTNSPLNRLAPLIWKIFDMNDELTKYQHNLPANTEKAYRDWLERVVNPALD
jgi:tetratricopeptide (TPR) repeat protein